MSILSIILLSLTGMLALSIVWWTLRTGISPMPSSKKAMDAMLDLIPPSVSRPIYELGSGWGGLTLVLAKRYPNVSVVGFELSPLPWAVSVLRAHLSRRKNVTFRRRDFFECDLSKAQVLVCYLYPGGMERLGEKLTDKMGADGTLISNTFRLPGCTPETVVELTDVYRNRVYRYERVVSDTESSD